MEIITEAELNHITPCSILTNVSSINHLWTTRSIFLKIKYKKYYEQEKFGFSASTLKGKRDLRVKVETYLNETCQPNIVLAQCGCRLLPWIHRGSALCENSVRKGRQHHHQAVLNGALNKALHEGILASNPLKSLVSKEKYQPSESIREYLTLKELKAAIAAPCPREDVKRAFPSFAIPDRWKSLIKNIPFPYLIGKERR